MDSSPIPWLLGIAIKVLVAMLVAGAFDYLGLKGVGWQFVRGVTSKVIDDLVPSEKPNLTQPNPIAADAIFWFTIKDSAVPGLFEEFIKKFPSSLHVAEARAKITELQNSRVVPSTGPSSQPTSPVVRCVIFNGKQVCG
jgi:hypothetical protein